MVVETVVGSTGAFSVAEICVGGTGDGRVVAVGKGGVISTAAVGDAVGVD